MGPIIEVYTDGSARGNPGPGGWAAVLVSGKYYKEFSGGFSCTTNNRMELLAVIKAIEAVRIPDSRITVWSDSSYVCDAVNKGWLFQWEGKGFAKKKNPDLWRRFLDIYRKHQVKFVWIKGHNGHVQNERCDTLAVEASFRKDLPADAAYVENNPDSSARAQTLLP